jgi:hypothetical protein
MYLLEDHFKDAIALADIAGVYWCSRDMDPGFLGNHHFFTFIYTSEEQAKRVTSKWKRWKISYHREENDKGLWVYFTTMGVGKDSDDNIKWSFNPDSDIWSIYEIAKNSNTSAFTVDRDFQGHLVEYAKSSNNYATEEELMYGILQALFNYKENYEAGNRVEYSLLDENCACGVNSVLRYLKFSASDRESWGEFWGVDWGEEDLISEDYFRVSYIANTNKKELHAPSCEWAAKILPEHKVIYTDCYKAQDEGYNGCAYCLIEIDTDTLKDPASLYKLHLISLVCHETEDISGADDAYVRVGGQRVWGPQRMNNGDSKNLASVLPIEFENEAKIDLYDQDSGTSLPLWLVTIDIDSDDFLGEYIALPSDTEAGEKSVNFTGDGANYTLTFSVEKCDPHTGLSFSADRYDLQLIKLHCAETEDFTGDDTTYLHANGIKVWGPHDMNNGDNDPLTGVPVIPFISDVKLDLYDQDGEIPGDDDDHLGQYSVKSTLAGLGEQTCSFQGDGANYTLTFKVTKQDS